MAKNIRDLIRSININDQNLSHISNTGLINGSLLLDIEKIINEHSLELLLQIEDLERQKSELRSSLLKLTGICVRHDLHNQSEIWMQIIERASRAIKQK